MVKITDPRIGRRASIVASLALFTDALLYGVAVPVLPLLADERGAPASLVGVLFGAYALALLAVTPLAGRWLDRRGPRMVMLVGLLGLAGATLLFVVVDAPGLLVVARVLQGLAAGVTWTASLALIAATHPAEARGQAMGAAMSAVGVGVLLGPPIGGALADWLGPHAPFVAVAALALVDAAARWRLLPAGTGERTSADAGEPMWRRPDVVTVALLVALAAGLIAFLEPILPLHARAELGAGRSAIGLMFGAGALAAVAGPAVVGRLLARARPPTLTRAGAVLCGLGFVLVGAARSAAIAAAGLAVVGFGAAFILTPALVVMAGIAEERHPPAYGSVYAMYNVAYAGGLAAAPLAAGLLDDAGGFVAASLVAAGIAVAVAAGSVLRVAWSAGTRDIAMRGPV
jgi:DHA1 family solute carrier family 18 vesicular amine transporter 1/2